jgi:hypothetical protein
MQDFASYEEYKAVHGVDLPLRDIEECALQHCITPVFTSGAAYILTLVPARLLVGLVEPLLVLALKRATPSCVATSAPAPCSGMQDISQGGDAMLCCCV